MVREMIEMLKLSAFLLTIFLVPSWFTVNGKRITIDVEVEKELAAMSKYSLRTIKTEYGDVYDCVDINKQPSLNHPLLKDHKVKIRPSLALEKILTASKKNKPSSENNPPNIGLKEGCPEGTVPIRRRTKYELKRAKSYFRTKYPLDIDPKSTRNQLSDFAGVFSYPPQGTLYKGVAANINLYNPRVERYHISAAYVMVQNGNSDRLGIIQAGWAVYPYLNLDYQTRLYSQWDQIYPNGSRDHSYGTMDPGFVVINKDFPVDAPFYNVSTINGAQFDEWFQLSMDPLSGDWWWSIGYDNIQIGYWPKELFLGLKDGASVGIFGGLAETAYDILSPPMGSGVFQDGNYDTTCNMRGVQVDIGNAFVSPYDDSVYVRPARCYKADKQKLGGDYTVLFGGPGGSPTSCA